MVSFIITAAYVNIKLGPVMKLMPFKLVYSRAELCPGNLMFMLANIIERDLFFWCPDDAATGNKLANLI